MAASHFLFILLCEYIPHRVSDGYAFLPSSNPLTFSGCALVSLLLSVKQTSTGCPDPHQTFDFFCSNAVAVRNFFPELLISSQNSNGATLSRFETVGSPPGDVSQLVTSSSPHAQPDVGPKPTLAFTPSKLCIWSLPTLLHFEVHFRRTEPQRQITHEELYNVTPVWREEFHILLSLPLCLYYCHRLHFHGDASSLSQIAFIIETLYIYIICFNRLESKWIIVRLMTLSRFNVLTNSPPMSNWKDILLTLCQSLSMSSHSVLLGFIIMAVSLLCCTAWKGLEILVSLSLPGHTGGGRMGRGACLQMWYSDLSTWYTAAITQHMLKKTSSNSTAAGRTCSDNEWNFVSGGQELTRLIHTLWYM